MTEQVYENILQNIGNTPIVKLERVVDAKGVNVLAKLEGFNPCSSVKDRIALSMIEDAERTGRLKKGMTILEPTSGNTGIGLAMIAAAKDYKLKIVMPETMSIERRKVLESMGVDIVLTPGSEGMNGAIERALELSDDPSYFMPNQFENPANVEVHYKTTGQEIIDQVGKVDVFVAGLGTSGTLMGVGRRLREENPNVKVVSVEPHQQSKIQGLRSLKDYVPPIFDDTVIDEHVVMDDEDAFRMSRRLMNEEGLAVGISSGAACYEAVRQADKLKKGTLVVILPDRAERYLSTDLFAGI